MTSLTPNIDVYYVIGYTRHNNICSRKHTCVIIQENGFSRAVDIAHEIGHT